MDVESVVSLYCFGTRLAWRYHTMSKRKKSDLDIVKNSTVIHDLKLDLCYKRDF